MSTGSLEAFKVFESFWHSCIFCFGKRNLCKSKSCSDSTTMHVADDDESDDDVIDDTEIVIPASLRCQSQYDKLYCCIYCEKLIKTKLSSHLTMVHKNEDQIKQLLASTTIGSQERKSKFIALEKKEPLSTT